VVIRPPPAGQRVQPRPRPPIVGRTVGPAYGHGDSVTLGEAEHPISRLSRVDVDCVPLVGIDHVEPDRDRLHGTAPVLTTAARGGPRGAEPVGM